MNSSMYIENISAYELKTYLFDKRYQIIDFRDFREYQKSHIKNAIHMDSHEVMSGNLDKIYKNKLVLYCERGGESMRMSQILAGKGYEVKNVIGGFHELKKFPEYIE